jgi:hypothetical protein
MKPTIIVIAHNRPHALYRLLDSLQKGEYPPDVNLIISIDAGGENGRFVHQIAHTFNWRGGEKQVIQQERPLGLISHFFACGDMSQEVGPIILLEDDLVVSPMFYHFAMQSLPTYADDARIAGISLNTLWFNGITHHPFVPYLDEADVFFMQVAWYQGQVYTSEMWQRFMAWRETAAATIIPSDCLHELFTRFPKTDWFPLKMNYLAQNGRFYVFPRESFTSNFGDIGTHFSRSTHWFQVPLQTRRRKFRFHSPDQSSAVYDSFQEMTPTCLNRLTDQFAFFDYSVDLNGTKSQHHLTTNTLTTRNMRNPLHTYGQVMWPMEANVITAVSGHDIQFGLTTNIQWGFRSDLAVEHKNNGYFKRWRGNGRKAQLRQLLAAQLARFRK